MKKIILAGCLFLLHAVSQAQTIFTYGNHKVEKEEFERMYKAKNASSPQFYTLKNIEEYIDLYAIFKMKVQDGYDQKINTTTNFVNDYNQFKAATAKSFLIDESIADNLLKEAYERSKYELEIAHIQISVRGNDTMEAYNKAMEIYNNLNAGAYTFEDAAKKYSEDGGSKMNGGNVGYISALDVLYPIESAAYNTEVGKYSKPVRSTYGYHIVKVLNKRPSKGSVQVAQILVQGNRKDPAAASVAKSKAETYYQRLKQGEDFTKLVKEYSEDKFSINNNGILAPFTAGKMDINFENAAFNLKNPGDISEPIQTDYGYHIIKLIKKMPNPSLAEAKEDLMARLKKDGRVELAEKAKYNQELVRLHYKENPENLTELIKAIEKDTVGKKPLAIETYKSFNKTLFSFNKKDYTQYDFVAFIIDATGGNVYGRREKTVKDLYSMYHDKMIEDAQVADLEANNKEFRSILKEYKESSLMFAMMEKEVWSKALNDNASLHQYYEQNKDNYKFKAGFAGNIFESGSKTTLEKFKTNIANGMTWENALDEVNKENAGKAKMQAGKYEYAQMPAKVSGLEVNTPSQVFEADNGNFFVIIPTELFGDNTQMSFEDARGQLVTNYQDYLDKSWVQKLKAKYPLKIFQKEVKKLAKK